MSKIKSTISVIGFFVLAATEVAAEKTITETFKAPNTTAQCVDVEPYTDDWGWNGTCSCRLSNNNQYIDFAGDLDTYENTVFVGSEESPLSCAESGTITVFELQGNGSLKKQAELVPSSRVKGDRFELRSTSKDLVSGTAWSTSTITVFGRTGESWQELYTLDGLNHVFFGDELLVKTDSVIKHYRATTGELLGTTQVPIPQNDACSGSRGNMRVHGNFLEVRHPCRAFWAYEYFNDFSASNIYEKSGSGQLAHQFTYEGLGGLSSVNNNNIVYSHSKYGGLVGDLVTTTIDHTNFIRGGNGVWERQATSTVSFANVPWRGLGVTNKPAEYTPLDDGIKSNGVIPVGTRVAVIQPEAVDGKRNLHFYELDNGSDWSLKQSISFNSSDFRINAPIYSDDHLLHIGSDRLSLFKRADDGQWGMLFEEPTEDNTYRGAMIGNHVFRFGLDTLVHTHLDENSGDDCDYSSSHLYDGWGWNPSTRQSCAPLNQPQPTTNANCDYTDAMLYDGWGWDPIAGQSCEPLNTNNPSVIENDCDYTSAVDNDGWGWNPTTRMSCSPRI